MSNNTKLKPGQFIDVSLRDSKQATINAVLDGTTMYAIWGSPIGCVEMPGVPFTQMHMQVKEEEKIDILNLLYNHYRNIDRETGIAHLRIIIKALEDNRR